MHAVEAALANPRREAKRIWLTENAQHRLQELIAKRQIPLELCRPMDLDNRLGSDTVHQGVLLEALPLTEPPLADLLLGNAPLIILDQVTDPHNVGAVLRSAAVFGAGGLVMTRRNSPPFGGALAKAASGALELVPIALVQNLARAIIEIKDAGVACIGLEGTGAEPFEDLAIDTDRPIAIVLGAEGRGLRQSTNASCDKICRLLTAGALSSLNVSNAAAVALHHLAYRRRLDRIGKE